MHAAPVPLSMVILHFCIWLAQMLAGSDCLAAADLLLLMCCCCRYCCASGALKLANHHHMTLLAERITAFLEQRLAWEEQQQQQQELEVAAGFSGGMGGVGQGHAGGGWSSGRTAVNGAGDGDAAPDDNREPEVVEVVEVEDPGEQAAAKPLTEVGNTAGSKGAGGGKPLASMFKKQGAKPTLGTSGGSGGVQQGVKRKPDIGSALGSSGGGGNPFARRKVNK